MNQGQGYFSGQKVGNDRFELRRELGRGGMGVVWLAADLELSDSKNCLQVALKFLTPDIQSDQEAVNMMRSEVQQSRKLHHPNIVSVFDWHANEGNAPCISMEYVDGVTLHQLRHEQEGHVLYWYKIRPLLKQLCAALHYAHAIEHIIHRDLKPSNIMLTRRNELKLADFGLAHGHVPTEEESSVNSLGGTPPYMSPQQLDGNKPEPADDIYSLGATLYELLTSKPPFFEGDIPNQIYNNLPEPIHDRLARFGLENNVPSNACDLIMQCLDKYPANRPQSAKSLSDNISSLGDGTRKLQSASQTGRLHFNPAPSHYSKKTRKKGRGIMPLLSFLLLMGAVGTGILLKWNKPKDEAKPATTSQKPKDETLSLKAYDHLALNTAFTLWKESPKAPGKLWNDRYWTSIRSGHLKGSAKNLNNLKAGNYLLEAEDSKNRRIIRPFTITAGTKPPTQMIDFNLVKARIHTTQPATVTALDFWGKKSSINLSLTGSASSSVYRGKDLNSRREGIVQYQIELEGHYPLTTNVFLENGGINIIDVDLIPRSTPFLKEKWTNSLEMVLVPFGNFWVSSKETTRRQFTTFAESIDFPKDLPILSTTETGWKENGDTWKNPGFEQGPNHPVVGINREEALQFCEWLTRKEYDADALEAQQQYSLLTRSQWKRAAGQHEYPWGNQWPPPMDCGNFATESAKSVNWPRSFTTLNVSIYRDPYPRTSSVASFRPNEFGLYDIAGNVSEWSLDVESESKGIILGSSWYTFTQSGLKTETYLSNHSPKDRHDWFGFRIVLIQNPGSH